MIESLQGFDKVVPPFEALLKFHGGEGFEEVVPFFKTLYQVASTRDVVESKGYTWYQVAGVSAQDKLRRLRRDASEDFGSSLRFGECHRRLGQLPGQKIAEFRLVPRAP